MTNQPANQSPTTGLTPYINLEGAGEASAFYQKAFGAEELMRLPAQDGKRLMHCCMKINNGFLMMSDCFPEMGGGNYEPSGSYTMHLQVDDIDAWWTRAVDAGATVIMPVQEMFWGDRYGQLKDPFGIRWSLGSPIKS